MSQDYGRWVPAYYKGYKANQATAGLPVLDENAWAQKYFGHDYGDWAAWRKKDASFEGASGAWRKEQSDAMIAKINQQLQQQHEWNPSIPYTAYNGATDWDSVSSAYTRAVSETAANKPKNINPDGTVNDKLDPVTGKELYVFKPSEIMKQAETQWQTDAGFMKNPDFVKGGESPEWIENPDFVEAERPEYNYDPSRSTKYFNTLSESEQPGTEKAVKRVQESFNFINPYATGSGSQVKAVASMMDDITANQQARAFALGTNEYDRNYSGEYADYEKKGAEKTNAMSSLLNLSQYYSTMANEATNRNEANYWKNLQVQNAYNLQTLQTQAEDKRYQRETVLMEKAVELNKPRENEWWTPFVGAAVGGLTSGIGSGLTSGVANKISRRPWNYNPYEAAFRAATT